MEKRKSYSIDEVLAHISEYQTTDRGFQITFVRRSGKNKGKAKSIQARYGAPTGHIRKTEKVVKNTEGGAYRGHRKIALHTDNFTIPITDLSNNEYNTPRISHIIGFENLKVTH